MSLREDCQTRGCSHDKATHFAAPESTGDLTKPGAPGRIIYGACLARACDCPKYEAPKR